MIFSEEALSFNKRILDLYEYKVQNHASLETQIFFLNVFKRNIDELSYRGDIGHLDIRYFNYLYDLFEKHYADSRIYEKINTDKHYSIDSLDLKPSSIMNEDDFNRMLSTDAISDNIFYITKSKHDEKSSYKIYKYSIKEFMNHSKKIQRYTKWDMIHFISENLIDIPIESDQSYIAINLISDRNNPYSINKMEWYPVGINIEESISILKDLDLYYRPNLIRMISDHPLLREWIFSLGCSPIDIKDGMKVSLDDIQENDLILEMPYDRNAFNHIIKSISKDLRIKEFSMAIYRIDERSIILDYIEQMKMRGVDVHVNIESKAFGDEETNARIYDRLKSSGLKISSYSDNSNPSYKVHVKYILIKYKDNENLKNVTILSTGNFHKTAINGYRDFMYITSNNIICDSISAIDGIIRKEQALEYIKDIEYNYPSIQYTGSFISNELSRRITEQGNLGKDGYILMKCNTFTNQRLREDLIKAAKKGCTVILIIRGICSVPAYNGIKVYSILGDILEHSRVYIFGNDLNYVYLSSADPVWYKLYGRIELLMKVPDKSIAENIRNKILSQLNSQEDPIWMKNKYNEYIMKA